MNEELKNKKDSLRNFEIAYLKKWVNEFKNNDEQVLELEAVQKGYDGIFLSNEHKVYTYKQIRNMCRLKCDIK